MVAVSRPGPTVVLRHQRVQLALMELRPGPGRPLLCLHGLGERTEPIDEAGATAPASPWSRLRVMWPGAVWGLDFTGHGSSDVPIGGGYSAELLMADADQALGHLGELTVAGRGLGAYVALLLAGARPVDVHGAILFAGPGLDGGRTDPARLRIAEPQGAPPPGPAGVLSGTEARAAAARAIGDVDLSADPYALAELALDVRPGPYAAAFAAVAARGGRDLPIAVCAASPEELTAMGAVEWLAAVRAVEGVEVVDVEDAVRRLAFNPDGPPTAG